MIVVFAGGVPVLRVIPSALSYRHFAASAWYRAGCLRAATCSAEHPLQEQGATPAESLSGRGNYTIRSRLNQYLVVYTAWTRLNQYPIVYMTWRGFGQMVDRAH